MQEDDMTVNGPFPGGTVDWSGENPGMYLKESQDGPFVGLVSFFRVVLSPHGRGQGVVLLEAPDAASSSPDALNVCVTDNEPLGRYLVENFVSNFGAFRGKPGLSGMEFRALHGVSTGGVSTGGVSTGGALPTSYSEELKGEGVEISLTWSGLGSPFMVDMAAEQSATGKHRMYSLFVDAGEAVANINGRRLKGRAQSRDFAGRRSSTAFLAFSETWVRV